MRSGITGILLTCGRQQIHRQSRSPAVADEIKIGMTADEWGQVMMVLQSGVYRVVAPLLQKINNQLVAEIQRNQTAANVGAQVAGGPRLVPGDSPPEAADD